ncbi:hypothetical protein SKPI104516_15375 [Skermania piniformis]
MICRAAGLDFAYVVLGGARASVDDGIIGVRYQGLEPRTRWLRAAAGQGPIPPPIPEETIAGLVPGRHLRIVATI